MGKKNEGKVGQGGGGMKGREEGRKRDIPHPLC